MSTLRHASITSNIPLTLLLTTTLLASSYFIPIYLAHIKSLTIVPNLHPTSSSGLSKNEAEDELRPSTLQILYEGTNEEIRAAVVKIVAKRILGSTEKDAIFMLLGSASERERNKGIKMMKALLYHPTLEGDNIARTDGYGLEESHWREVVQALINVMPKSGSVLGKGREEVDKLPPSPLLPPDRSPAERDLLRITATLLSSSHAALEAPRRAGLVTQWLAQYPFPCAVHPTRRFKRKDVVALYTTAKWSTDDPLMSKVMNLLRNSGPMIKELRKVGLKEPWSRDGNSREARRLVWRDTYDDEGLASSDEETAEDVRRRGTSLLDALVGGAAETEIRNDNEDILMSNGEDTAGLPISAFRSATGNASLSSTIERAMLAAINSRNAAATATRPTHSAEEARLRRQHREAVVVAERGEPLGRENILQFEDSEEGDVEGMERQSERESRERMRVSTERGGTVLQWPVINGIPTGPRPVEEGGSGGEMGGEAWAFWRRRL